jgi:hypothetical protein
MTQDEIAFGLFCEKSKYNSPKISEGELKYLWKNRFMTDLYEVYLAQAAYVEKLIVEARLDEKLQEWGYKFTNERWNHRIAELEHQLTEIEKQ